MVQALERPAFRLAVLLTRDPFVAEEIVQEAFVRAWRRLDRPVELPAFRAWLYKTIVNLTRDHYRRQTRWNRLRLRPPAPSDPTEQAERRASDAALAAAIRTLSRSEREAIYLRFFEDTPYADVARIIGTREDSTRVLVHRALKKLRNHLTAAGLESEGFTP